MGLGRGILIVVMITWTEFRPHSPREPLLVSDVYGRFLKSGSPSMAPISYNPYSWTPRTTAPDVEAPIWARKHGMSVL